MSESVTIAEQAAAVLGINVAGVDILVSEKDNLPYVIEVNKAPDIKDEFSLKSVAGYLESLATQASTN